MTVTHLENSRNNASHGVALALQRCQRDTELARTSTSTVDLVQRRAAHPSRQINLGAVHIPL